MLSCILLSVFAFLFLRPYHAHKLDFCSSTCVFLGNSSSHLGYRCLDLASQRIYVSCHVCFHKDVFPFANSEQIAQQRVTSSQPTHLPTLNSSLNFHPTAPPTHNTNSFALALAEPNQTHHSPTMSATTPSPPNSASLSLSAYFSNDHHAGIGSSPSELQVSRFVTVEKTGSAAGSPISVTANSSPPIGSPADL
jgi:hypothetical protein